MNPRNVNGTVLLDAMQVIAEDCQRRLRKGFDNGDNDTLRKCMDAIERSMLPTSMTSEEIAFANQALIEFLDNERDKGAIDGLAYTTAESLLEEGREGGPNCFTDIPEIKLAILNYCIEQKRESDSLAENDSQTPEAEQF